jgi:CDP-diacylglycerol--glycerol-3-phosphate 3-phosphatidyltransferase
MNLPNSITMSRIVMIPLLLWILTPHFPWHAFGAQEITASVLFVLASITDGLDGYLARKRGQITTMGMLLDPIADKIMVTSALVALVAYNPQPVVKVWIAVVIIGREFLISGLRSIASSEGFTIQASDLGKLKTVIQIVCVVSAILAHGWDQWQIGVLIVPVRWIAIAAIYFTVLVSSISAIDYFVGFWKQIDHASKDRRKASVMTRS